MFKEQLDFRQMHSVFCRVLTRAGEYIVFHSVADGRGTSNLAVCFGVEGLYRWSQV